jgi:uncharacterized protein YjbI with pentapeptide repeats
MSSTITNAPKKFEIKDIYGNVLHSVEGAETILQAVEKLAKEARERDESANLRYANLQRADLQSANLQSANLQSADLRYADLRYANLQSANLQSADLRYANLRYANLQSANLQSADLRYADLRYANLQSADLQSANLQSANLQSADLEPIRQDVLAVLIAAPHEVVGLRQAFAEGRINGSIYEDGECVCLIGTAERLQAQRLEGSPFNKPIPGLVRASSRPAERFVYGLQPGDTPENSQFSALMVKWIDEFLAAARAVAETLPPVDELKEN